MHAFAHGAQERAFGLLELEFQAIVSCHVGTSYVGSWLLCSWHVGALCMSTWHVGTWALGVWMLGIQVFYFLCGAYS